MASHPGSVGYYEVVTNNSGAETVFKTYSASAPAAVLLSLIGAEAFYQKNSGPRYGKTRCIKMLEEMGWNRLDKTNEWVKGTDWIKAVKSYHPVFI